MPGNYAQGANRSARLLASLATVNAAVAFDEPCQLRTLHCSSHRSSLCYIKIYALDQTLAAPTAAMTPFDTIEVPANTPFIFDFASGIDFNFGMGYRITSGVADADTGAIGAGDITCLTFLAAN